MRTASLIVALLAAVSARAADETYKLKLKAHLDAGQSQVLRETSTDKTRMIVRDDQGKEVNRENNTEKTELEYTVTMLERKGDKAAKYKRVYKKSATVVNNKRTPHSYEGRTVLFELKGGKYEVRAEGKPELNPKDLAKLVKEANKNLKGDLDQLMIPDRPVKVGEGWVMAEESIKKLGDDLGEVDPKKSSGKGKLLKVYKKGGKTWGVMEIKMSFAVKKIEGVVLDPPGALHMKGTLDTPIDGSSTAGTMKTSFRMTGKAKVKMADGSTVIVEMDTEASGTTEKEDKE
jgi:hypothetical protein